MLDFFSRLAMSLLYNLKQFTIMCPDTQNVYKFTFILLLFYFIFSFKMKNWWQVWNGGLKWSSATTIFWSRDFRFPDLRENFSLHRSKFKKKLRKNFWIGLLSIFFICAERVSFSGSRRLLLLLWRLSSPCDLCGWFAGKIWKEMEEFWGLITSCTKYRQFQG